MSAPVTTCLIARFLSLSFQPWEKVRKFVQALSPFTLQFNKKKYAWVQLAGHQGMYIHMYNTAVLISVNKHVYMYTCVYVHMCLQCDAPHYMCFLFTMLVQD